MSPARRPGQAGFTLVELLVAFAVAVLLLAGATAAFRAGAAVLEFGVDQAASQATARWAVERMIQEIRGAGYDPTAGATYNFEALDGVTGTSLVLQNDLNGNGVLDPAGACDPVAPERVRYRWVGTELRRSANPANPDCEEVVAGGILGLTFGYCTANGCPSGPPESWPLPPAAAIRTVHVRVTVSSDNGAGERTVLLEDRVRLRNR
jgi:prepilin-type N-terminal cleavage/methylation domain-containing protein